MYLLDTNIISETRRPNRVNSGVKTWLESTDAAMLYTSAINIMELERGVLRLERKDKAQGQVLRDVGGDVRRSCRALNRPLREGLS